MASCKLFIEMFAFRVQTYNLRAEIAERDCARRELKSLGVKFEFHDRFDIFYFECTKETILFNIVFDM